MTASPDSDEALRRVFTAGTDVAPGDGDDGDCPSPERMWAAIAGELPAAERRAIVDHSSRCAACAEDFRMATAMVRQAPAPRPAPAAAKGAFDFFFWLQDRLVDLARAFTTPGRRPVWVMAALVIVGLSVGFQLRNLKMGETPEYRGLEEKEIVSLLGVAPRLSRQAAQLRWKGPEGARFELTLTTTELRVVQVVRDLEEPAFQLPAEILAPFPDGTRLLWRVEALLPDGRRLSSPTFDFELTALPTG